MKYIHLCMLMYVEMDFNLVQLGADICGLLVYIYIYIYIYIVCIFNKLFLHSFCVYIVLCT